MTLINVTTKQLCSMLEMIYKRGVKDKEENNVTPASIHAAVEEIIIAHLRNGE